MTVTTKSAPPASTGIARWQMPALILGILGVVASVIGFVMDAKEFYRAYLPSFMFWFLIAVGSLGVLMLQYVTGGQWGVLIRRPLGAAARTIWIFVIFLIPVFLGMKHVYIWANPDVVAHDHVLQLKGKYLNVTAWLIRAAFYFVLWTLWAWRVRVLSLQFYKDRAPETDLARRKWAASGLLMFVLTVTFMSIDWTMSVEPKWYSTMYGISFVIGAGLSAFAFVTFFLTLISGSEAMEDILRPIHFRDLGNLMLAFTMLWAYTAFSEFLLIWYGNLKEEIPYYLKRMHGGWGVMAAALILFHFFLPFFMLLMRPIKDKPRTIAIVTVIILFMRYIDLYWLVAPAHYGEHFYFSWMSVAALAAIGGLWLFAFIGQLKGQTIIPIHETWVEEALREGAVRVHA